MERTKRKILTDWIIQRTRQTTLLAQVEASLAENEKKFNEVLDGVKNVMNELIGSNNAQIKSERHGFERLITICWVEGKRSKKYQFNKGISILFKEVSSVLEIYFGGNRLDGDSYHSVVSLPGITNTESGLVCPDLMNLVDTICLAIKPPTVKTAQAYDCTLSGGETVEQMLDRALKRTRRTT